MSVESMIDDYITDVPDVPDEKYCEDCGGTIGEGEEAVVFLGDYYCTECIGKRTVYV